MADPKLVEYVKDALAKRYSAEEIKKILLEQGWSSTIINEAFDEAQKKAFPEGPPPLFEQEKGIDETKEPPKENKEEPQKTGDKKEEKPKGESIPPPPGMGEEQNPEKPKIAPEVNDEKKENEISPIPEESTENTPGFKKRNPVMMALLPFVTFGISAIVWTFMVTSELKKNNKDAPGTGTALLMFIPFVNIYFYWKFSDAAAKATNKSAAVYFLLYLFVLPVAIYMIQADLNNI